MKRLEARPTSGLAFEHAYMLWAALRSTRPGAETTPRSRAVRGLGAAAGRLVLILVGAFLVGGLQGCGSDTGTSSQSGSAGASSSATSSAAATAGAPPALGADGWNQSCRFVMSVNGGPDPTSVLYERRGTADIVGSVAGYSWFVVRPSSQRLHLLMDGTVEPAGPRSVRLLAEPMDTGEPLTRTSTSLDFAVEGHALRIMATPPLLGDTTARAFLDLCPEYQEREAEYVPESEALQQIASMQRDLTLEVYFGSWCPHCQVVLPELIKSLRLADNDQLDVRMIGLPRNFALEPRAAQREVRNVPTLILFEAGRELGRFSGNEGETVEHSLAALVSG